MGTLTGKSPAAIGLGAALALQGLVGAFAVFVVGDHGWDDGAITLAFARTFAEHGELALNASSAPVEGFSSPAWLLLNAAAAVFRPGFAGAIAISQILATLCLMVCSGLMFAIGRRLSLKDGVLAAVLIVFALIGPAVAEAANGMEMALLAACGLALVHALYFRPNGPVAVLAAVLFLTTRFEAIFYYGLLIAPLLLERRARSALILAALGLAVFGLQEWARVMLFGELLPNTILAKMHAPYSVPGEGLHSRLQAFAQLAVLTAPLWITLFFVGVADPRGGRGLFDRRRAFPVLFAPVLAVELFALVTGVNQGYPGRMMFLGLPFALLLFAALYEVLAAHLRADFRRAVLIIACVITVQISLSQSAPGAVPVTPDTYRQTGLSVERLRARLGLARIAFVTPDVGGLGLCCDAVRVIDLALLTNGPLARHGYGALPALLAAERPDVIEAHRGWADASGIYDLPVFKADYRPAVIDGLRVYLRADHAARLLAQRQASWCALTAPACLDLALQGHRYALDATHADDLAFLQGGGFVLMGPISSAAS